MLNRYLEDDCKDDGRKEIGQDESFFPNPKITFLVDKPTLNCQICQETPLEIGATDCRFSNDSLVILPCGHVACDGCMSTWVKEHKSCPFCRQNLKRSACKHHVMPLLIAHDTIHTLPKTLPQGGAISSRCKKCNEQASREKIIRDYEVTIKRYKDARRHYEKSGSESAFKEMKRLEDGFESYSVDKIAEDIYTRKTKW